MSRFPSCTTHNSIYDGDLKLVLTRGIYSIFRPKYYFRFRQKSWNDLQKLYVKTIIKYGYIMNRYMYVMLMGGVFVENTHQETTKFPELIGDGNLL